MQVRFNRPTAATLLCSDATARKTKRPVNAAQVIPPVKMNIFVVPFVLLFVLLWVLSLYTCKNTDSDPQMMQMCTIAAAVADAAGALVAVRTAEKAGQALNQGCGKKCTAMTGMCRQAVKHLYVAGLLLGVWMAVSDGHLHDTAVERIDADAGNYTGEGELGTG